MWPQFFKRPQSTPVSHPADDMDALREDFDRQGFLAVDLDLEPDLLDGVRRDTEEYYLLDGRIEPDGSYKTCTRATDIWRTCQTVRELAIHPRILSFLQSLYGRRPRAFQTLNFPVGSEQPVHSDTIHFNSEPRKWMCGVWVALEDVTPDTGPLVYYPGSHRLPEYTLEDVRKFTYLWQHNDRLRERVTWPLRQWAPDYVPKDYLERTTRLMHYRAYEIFIRRMIRVRGLIPEYGLIKKGTVFIWASNLLHGGTRIRSLKKSRHSQVTHFFFEDCRYLTPILSWGENIHWRKPRFIDEFKCLDS